MTENDYKIFYIGIVKKKKSVHYFVLYIKRRCRLLGVNHIFSGLRPISGSTN